MKSSQCITHFYNYQRMNVKKNTLRNYEFILDNFQKYFGETNLSSITSEDILAFMSTVSDGTKQNTKKLRFTLLSAFFNFVKNSIDPGFQNLVIIQRCGNCLEPENHPNEKFWKRMSLMKSFSESKIYETG